jgi:HK97 family phage prohead protease
MKHEIRTVPIRIEKRDDDGSVTLVSHAPPWESLSVDLGGFREKFERGAFVNLDDDIVSTFEHDSSKILGRRSADTLRLKEDGDGLRYEVDLDGERTTDRDLVRSIDRGDVNGSSFEFAVNHGGEKWEEDDEGRSIRTVVKGGARLFQVGPVTNAAYQETTVALRSLDTWRSDKDGWAQTREEALARAKRRLRLAEAESVL